MAIDNTNRPDIDDATIAKLRRMIAEPGGTIYSDEVLKDYIYECPVQDTIGRQPLLNNSSDVTLTPTYEPTISWSQVWLPTWDLNLVAANIWQEKAAALAVVNFNMSGDGQSFSLDQRVQQAERQERHYRARRNPKTTFLKTATGVERDSLSYIANR